MNHRSILKSALTLLTTTLLLLGCSNAVDTPEFSVYAHSFNGDLSAQEVNTLSQRAGSTVQADEIVYIMTDELGYQHISFPVENPDRICYAIYSREASIDSSSASVSDFALTVSCVDHGRINSYGIYIDFEVAGAGYPGTSWLVPDALIDTAESVGAHRIAENLYRYDGDIADIAPAVDAATRER